MAATGVRRFLPLSAAQLTVRHGRRASDVWFGNGTVLDVSLPAAGTRLRVRTALCTNDTGAKLQAKGDKVTLYVVGSGTGTLDYIVAAIDGDPLAVRLVWDDVSPGVEPR
jgi:hypothetical protein